MSWYNNDKKSKDSNSIFDFDVTSENSVTDYSAFGIISNSPDGSIPTDFILDDFIKKNNG